MILPDVNVLIYAFRQDVPEHALCRSWLEREIAGDATFGISPLTLSAVVRIHACPQWKCSKHRDRSFCVL